MYCRGRVRVWSARVKTPSRRGLGDARQGAELQWQVPCIFLRLTQPRCAVTGDEIDCRPLVTSNGSPRTSCQRHHLGHQVFQVRLTAGRHCWLPEEAWAMDRQISVCRHGRFLRGQPVGSLVFSLHEPGTHTEEAASPRAEETWQVERSDENAETADGQCRIASGPC